MNPLRPAKLSGMRMTTSSEEPFEELDAPSPEPHAATSSNAIVGATLRETSFALLTRAMGILPGQGLILWLGVQIVRFRRR
jgi:hypothetical protein